MEGLNKLCLYPCTIYPSMHGLSSVAASHSRSKLKNPKPMGDHSNINNGTDRLPHFKPIILPPYISPKPLFLPKIVTLSPIFFPPCPIQNFGNFSLRDPKLAGIWKKKKKKCAQIPHNMAFVTERSAIFCLACTCLFEGHVAPSNMLELGKFCILETESCNLS